MYRAGTAQINACGYIHAKESISENGTFLCAASREQAERAVSYIGDNCHLVEKDTSDHVIPKAVRDIFGLTGGQRLIVLSDDKEGIALVPAEVFETRVKKAMDFASVKAEVIGGE